MKIRSWTVGIAVLALGGARAAAADAGTSAWTYDNNVSSVAFASACDSKDSCAGDGCADDSCCDPGCGDGCDCGDACGGGGLLAAVEGFTLAGLIGLEDPYEIGGWSNLAYYDNNIPLSQTKGDLLSFDDIPDRANLAQQWFYLGKKTDGSGGLDLGGRVDVVYGTDAQKTQAFGNPRSQPGLNGVQGQGTFDASLDHGYYGWAIPQAYAEIATGDLAVKIGHFFTPLGYEVIPATGNFFHSHSYTMYNSEPFTHTGGLATYTGLESLTLYGGWSAGWDSGFDQVNSGSTLISGFAYELAEGVTFTYLNTYGNFGWRDGGDDNSYSHAIVLAAALTDNLQYIAQSDMVDTSNPGVSNYDTVGLNQYLIYQLNDWIGIGGRLEWWKADGVSYYGATSGLNIKALDNLVIRPEYRQDWAPGDGAINGSVPGGFGSIDEDTFAVDAILTY